MKAWHFTGPHQPLVRTERSEPSVEPGQVRIAVKAAGLCHSDVGILEDEKWLSIIPNLPITPGHEIAGVIDEVGAGVTAYASGDRVCVWPMLERPGYAIDGGFGEKVVVSTQSLIRIPDGVPFEFAATATDAGMTSHGAVMTRGGLRPGERVGIIGVGGLGQIGARIVVLNGAELYVAEVNEAAWPIAKEIGAKRIVKDIAQLKGEKLDLIVDFAGFGTTTAAALETVSPGGRVVLVGMGRLEATINTYPLILGGIDLRGNVGGTAQDIASVLDWMSKGEIQPRIEKIRWDQIADGIDRLRRGDVRGRLVCMYE
jgi:propanol-preferring alcohol dehydrogenase